MRVQTKIVKWIDNIMYYNCLLIVVNNSNIIWNRDKCIINSYNIITDNKSQYPCYSFIYFFHFVQFYCYLAHGARVRNVERDCARWKKSFRHTAATGRNSCLFLVFVVVYVVFLRLICFIYFPISIPTLETRRGDVQTAECCAYLVGVHGITNLLYPPKFYNRLRFFLFIFIPKDVCWK